MRILFIAPQAFFVPRGTPIAVRAALDALGEQGHRIDLLTSAVGRDVEIPNVRIHRVRRVPFASDMPIGSSWQRGVSDLFILRAALTLMRGVKYDVIHGVEDGAILAWILARRGGMPYVYDMDSHMSSQLGGKGLKGVLASPMRGILHVAEKQALRKACGVLAVCPALAEIARDLGARNVVVVPDMPLQDGSRCTPSSELVAIGGTRIVYVGNLEHYQGVDLLLRGFERVAPAHPDARLIIVGGREDHIANHEGIVPDLVADGRVHFLGPRPVEDLGSILAGADILVSPRRTGVNTPMKTYSYLESGRPVLATRLLTHTQVLDDRVACLVPDTAVGMAEGLERLLSDPDLRRDLGAKGREHVRREYGRDRFISRMQTFYDDLPWSRTAPEARVGPTDSASDHGTAP